MSDQQPTSSSGDQKSSSFSVANRFQSFGMSLRQSAQDITAKATNELSKVARVGEEAVTAAVATTPAATTTTGAMTNGTTMTPASSSSNIRVTSTTNVTSSSNSSPSPATLDGNVKAADVRELVDKMSKKIKALSIIRQQLTVRAETAEAEKARLLNFVTEEILNGAVPLPPPTPPPTNGDQNTAAANLLSQLQQAWRQQDEQNNLTLQHMQVEFQKLAAEANRAKTELQQQQAALPSNGTSGAADGEAEKKALLQSHEAALQAVAAENAANLQMVREEATKRLSEFKQKVAAARSAEITKIKNDAKQEAATAAKKILETKLREQKETFEAQLVQLQQQQLQQSSSSSNDEALALANQARELDRQHHEATMAQVRSEYETRLANLTDDNGRRIADLEEQLAAAAQSSSDAVWQEKLSLLEAEKQQLQSIMAHESQQATDRVRELEQCMTRLQNEAGASLEGARAASISRILELESVVKMLEAERADVFAQQRLLDTDVRAKDEAAAARVRELEATIVQLQANHATAAQEAQSAMEAAQQSAGTKQQQLETAMARLTEDHTQALEHARSRALEVLQAKDTALDQAKAEQQRQTMEISTRQDEIENLRRALLEAKTLAKANGENGAAMDQALSEQRSSFERQITGLKQQSQQNAQVLQDTINKLQQELTQSTENMTAVQINATESNRALQTQVDALTNEMAEQSAVDKASIEYFQGELRQKAETVAKMQEEHAALIEQLKKEYNSGNEDATARCTDLGNQLANLARTVQETEGARTKIETEYTSLQTAYQELLQERAAAKESQSSENSQSQEQARMTITQLQTQIRELTMELDAVRQALNEGNSIWQVRGEEIEALQAKLVETETRGETLATELQALKESTTTMLQAGQDLQKLEATILELEKSKADLVAQMETAEASFAAEREKMRIAMESHVDNMTKQFKAKLEASRAQAAEEINSLQAAGKEKDEKLSSLVGKLKALTAGATKMKDDNDGLKKRLESELAKQKSLQSQFDAAQKRVEEVTANGSATASSLLKHQETLEKEKMELQNRAKQMKNELSNKSNKVEELTGKLQALSNNLNVLTNDLRTKDEKLEMASKLESRLKTSEEEVARLREQVNKLKLEQMKNATLVEKLQSEKEANEQSQGERTAVVRMLEGQIADISEELSNATAKLEAASYDLQQKEEDLNSATAELEKVKAQFDEINEEAKRSSEALALAQKGADAKSTKALEAIQKELQVTKQQMARKSAAAQRLLQQREAECAQLRKTNKDLQQEVDKGSYSDRKIFELAELQSNRESQQVSEIELRDSIIERLRQALLERDGDLASAEKHVREIDGQIEELCRIQRREDVNLDYLKRIVVKYLSFPTGSTERTALLRVLATLLQFDDKDYKIIEAGKNRVSWWGGAVVPTMIAPSAKSGPATTGSAEVSVSAAAATTSGKPATSLQF